MVPNVAGFTLSLVDGGKRIVDKGPRWLIESISTLACAASFTAGIAARIRTRIEDGSLKRTNWSRPLLLIPLVLAAGAARGEADPLPSWNEGLAKQEIIAYVARVTATGSPDHVPVAERIAVFDNDGTLWPENPLPFQLFYALDSLKRKAANAPELADDPMVHAALDGDFAKLLEGEHHEGLLRISALTHAGMTTDEFCDSVAAWLAQARHPRYHRPFTELAYQPMLELLAYLRSNGFKTFIVSGGGADFLRVWTEDVYGIPPEQVVGTTSRTTFTLRDGVPTLVKTMDHLFVDDKAGKPVGIHQFIGRRPIACFGNSDGDQAMLQYTTIGNPRPSFGLIVHHTDADREYAYDAAPTSSGKLVSALEEAGERHWTVVDMKRDWKCVFGDAP